MKQSCNDCGGQPPKGGNGSVSRRHLLYGTAAVAAAAAVLQAGSRPALAAAPADVQGLADSGVL